jgi:predicted phage gp36 major capsid-like protein
MAKKPLAELSSDELYRLAQEREEQEEQAAKEAVRAQLDDLRKKRREVMARHRKELAAIDAEIRNLGGRTARGKRRGSGDGSVTENVLEIVSNAKKISTKEIKAELEQRGVVANNLAQTLAYLKRQGKVTSPARSIYSLA